MKATEPFKLTINLEHPSLVGHFPGEPIVPGAILLDHAISYVERSSAKRVSRVAVAKFIVPVRPRQVVVITVDTTAYDRVSLLGAVADVKVLSATLRLEDRVER